MKKVYFFVFILAFTAGFGGVYCCQSSVENRSVHIFTEGFATNPALTQMTQFIQLPKSTPKIIGWHRFPNRGAVLNLAEYNTTELNFPRREAISHLLSRAALKKVQEILAKNPGQKFVLHGNLSHVDRSIYPFLREIPKKNIARIHLYEDGYGELFKGKGFHTQQSYAPPLSTDMKKIIETGEGKWKYVMNFSLQKIYPTTYHLMHVDKIKELPFLAPLRSWLSDAKIKNVDFNQLRDTLTLDQKELLYKLTGFDYKKYADLMKDKPTIVFVMGYFFGASRREQAEQNWLKSLMKSSLPPLPAGQTYTWFYKPHPSLSQPDVRAQMEKDFPDVHAIPAQIPFEILIVADLKPTYTAGFSSSLFYSLQSSDVLYYAIRPNDNYLPFLMNYGLIKKKQLTGLGKYMPTN